MRTITGFLLLAVSCGLHAQDSVLTRAMKDEMARSLKQLQLENLDKPYFISYRVAEQRGRNVSATFGALLHSREQSSRMLTVEVRVGGYQLDNTNFFAPFMGGTGVARMWGGTVQLPLEDDYKELRRQIWLATDGAYKKALEDLSKKRAALQNKTRTDETPDLTREQPAVLSEQWPPARIVPAEMERLVKEFSALFKEMPDVAHSSVSLSVVNTATSYLNSEGFFFTRLRPSAMFLASASTQAGEGMPLHDFFAAYARSVEELPSREQLAARIRSIGANLKSLRAASLVEQYNGPVLFEGQAAAELFAQAFVPNLVATRRPLSDNPGFERYLAQAENPFVDKIGARVLPSMLSVTDNPTLAQYLNLPLAGSYRMDDEGIAGRETRLVENGILKTLLSSRDPVRGIEHSSGSLRGQGAMPSNLIVTSEGGLSQPELRAKFLELVKQRGREYGILVRRLGNPALKSQDGQSLFMFDSSSGELRVEPAILAYKVFPDGREELVRNAEIAALSAATFKEIVAVSKEQTVYTAPFHGRAVPNFSYYMGGETSPGGPPATFVVPALLFEDLTVNKPRGEVPKPPVAMHPYFEK